MATVIKWEGVEVATVQSANQESPYCGGQTSSAGAIFDHRAAAVQNLAAIPIPAPSSYLQGVFLFWPPPNLTKSKALCKLNWPPPKFPKYKSL